MALFPNLRRQIKQVGVSWVDVAAAGKMNIFDLHLKMLGLRRWTITDAVRLCGFLRSPDPEHLFVRKHCKR